MTLRLERKPAVDDAILGRLFVNGDFEAFTLERLGVQIPLGTYPVVITPSFRFGRLLPLIDVPGRVGIRIHPLNVAQETEGCIGVGQEETMTSLRHSKLAMDALQPKLAAVLARGEAVTLTIQNAAPDPRRA